MFNPLWKLLAGALARPAVVDWLIKRAAKTPYSHIEKDGEAYMERYWLFNRYRNELKGAPRFTWLPSIRLHKILIADRDDHMHDHPWNARTIILRGWYTEARAEHGCAVMYFRDSGDTVAIRFGDYHAITAVADAGVWTMFFTWKYVGTWGFLVDGKKLPWRTYLGLEKK